MFRHLLQPRVHRATATHCRLHVEGSCGNDENLLEASIIRANEQVHVWNINYGERFITHTIKSPRGRGIISLKRSAARRASVGDLVNIATFGVVHGDKLDDGVARLVFPDKHKRIVEVRSEPAGPQAGDMPTAAPQAGDMPTAGPQAGDNQVFPD